jgi:7-carboxy-7-deazaguanine synthase (Cx14CxxC type)
VFCRFAGCNLWTGREEDRVAAVCKFCDTDFVGTNGPGGGKFDSAEKLADAVAHAWTARKGGGRRLVVCTGGEPLLQLDGEAIDAFHARGFEIAVETNGTVAAPAEIDWVCVSPKADVPLVQRSGSELKLVFPQVENRPEQFEGLAFQHFFLQPMDGPNVAANTQQAVRYCMEHPTWRLSLQTHKLLGIP